MKTLVRASYTEIASASIAATPELAARLLQLKMPAFVIHHAGSTLAEAVSATGIATILRANGYGGDVRDRVDFGSDARQILPKDLTWISRPVGDEWTSFGVTPLHSDLCAGQEGQQFSLNLTITGSSEIRLHENRIAEDDLVNQWDILDPQVGDLLWDELADPEIISPEGFRTELTAGDLLIFDPSYAHMVRGLSNPRYSEATFFEKQTLNT